MSDSTALSRSRPFLIVACLTGGPGAREAAERAVGEMTWTDPEGFMSGGIIVCRLGLYDLALLGPRSAGQGSER